MLFFNDCGDKREVGWDSLYSTGDTRAVPKPGVADYQQKLSRLEDACTERWQSNLKFGRWVTADESRGTGWYSSTMTIETEPKPVQTGAIIHSLCVSWSSKYMQAICPCIRREIRWGSRDKPSKHHSPSEIGQPL